MLCAKGEQVCFIQGNLLGAIRKKDMANKSARNIF